MLGRIFRKKKCAPVTIDVFLDRATNDRFRAFIEKNGLDENAALVQVLERGMANYWLQIFKQMRQNYSLLERSFKEYSKDNEVLSELEQQTDRLRSFLETKLHEKTLSTHRSME